MEHSITPESSLVPFLPNPSTDNSSDFDHHRLVLHSLEFHVDRIKQCVVFCLASAQHFWRFISVIEDISTLFSFIVEDYFIEQYTAGDPYMCGF